MSERAKWILFAGAVLGAYAVIFAPELIKEWPTVKAVVKGIFERQSKTDGPDSDPGRVS